MAGFALAILFLNSKCEGLEDDDYELFGEIEISGIGDVCENDTDCGPNDFWLQCVEDECVCQDGMINLNSSAPCISKIDSACDDATATPKECIANARCLEAAESQNVFVQ